MKAMVVTANDNYYDVVLYNDDGYEVCCIDCGKEKEHAEEIAKVISQKALFVGRRPN